MHSALKTKTIDMNHNDTTYVGDDVLKSWDHIAPGWPLKNIVASNPLKGFENLHFQSALQRCETLFEQKQTPESIDIINRQTVKYLQLFFDEGQATIPMPGRHLGLLKSLLNLWVHDSTVTQKNPKKIKWIQGLIHQEPADIITSCLDILNISKQTREPFLTLLLTTLPGWAAHVQYMCHWNSEIHEDVLKFEYTAVRLILACLLDVKPSTILDFYKTHQTNTINDGIRNQNHPTPKNSTPSYAKILDFEQTYRTNLVADLQKKSDKHKTSPDAQFVFCIDVRSEPFRRALESKGRYETFGFAGFFGVPVSVTSDVTQKSHNAFPVLLNTCEHVLETPTCTSKTPQTIFKRFQTLSNVYESIKNTFATPFSLVEILGSIKGVWMLLKSAFPNTSGHMRHTFKHASGQSYDYAPSLDHISFENQVGYAHGALKTMGFEKFARFVVFCAHGSTTQNNPYATALDCGACGGNAGGPNARILAKILNTPKVRNALKSKNLHIPETTTFLAAQHDTTTDDVVFFDNILDENTKKHLKSIQNDLKSAGLDNANVRLKTMENHAQNGTESVIKRSQDWGQVRPEWGLCRNASFVIGPRHIYKHIDFDGRTFLHSYNYETDGDGSALESILTAPVIVAQWINNHYFFTSYNNQAFGSGSKVTQNVTGKFAIMQGAGSDILHGLPMQSLYKNDATRYHDLIRLHVVAHAPKSRIHDIIMRHDHLKMLFQNEWIYMICHDPVENRCFLLNPDFTWKHIS